jgi:hypothetical protein
VRRYVVEVGDKGDTNVIDEYGRETGLLTLGEMLEHMVSLSHRELSGKPLYRMLTPQGWEERAYRLQAGRALKGDA